MTYENKWVIGIILAFILLACIPGGWFILCLIMVAVFVWAIAERHTRSKLHDDEIERIWREKERKEKETVADEHRRTK